MHKIPSTIIEESSEASVEVKETVPEAPAQEGFLIAIIADEDTCVGYILGGIGEINEDGVSNYFVVSPGTTDQEIEDAYWDFVNRKDIALILITVNIADRIHLPHKKSKDPPVIIEIPDKNGPYFIDIDYLIDMAEEYESEKSDKMKQYLEKRSSVNPQDPRLEKRSSVNSQDHRRSFKEFEKSASSSRKSS